MTTLWDKTDVDEVIASNGSDGTTHIIEYLNVFDRGTAWKLCRGEKMYEYAMETGAFIKPKLIWTKEEEEKRMISRHDFKLNINTNRGFYPIVYPNMVGTLATGVILGELLCPVPACLNKTSNGHIKNSLSTDQHLMAARISQPSIDAPDFDPDFDHDRAVISFSGECGHDWELRFESHHNLNHEKGYIEISIANVENKAG